MSLNNPEYANEIQRQETRLNGLRSEVADLTKEKGIHQNDIERLTKHLSYLDELKGQKDAEVERKQAVIAGLDGEIEARQARSEKLQSEVNLLSATLEEKKDELIEVETKLLSHDKKMTGDVAQITTQKEETAKLAEWHDGRVAKLRQFLNELN